MRMPPYWGLLLSMLYWCSHNYGTSKMFKQYWTKRIAEMQLELKTATGQRAEMLKKDTADAEHFMGYVKRFMK